jgi:hypothetical protein
MNHAEFAYRLARAYQQEMVHQASRPRRSRKRRWS